MCKSVLIIDGGWSAYKNSTCTPCGKPTGTLLRNRTCSNPKPAYGGTNCTPAAGFGIIFINSVQTESTNLTCKPANSCPGGRNIKDGLIQKVLDFVTGL